VQKRYTYRWVWQARYERWCVLVCAICTLQLITMENSMNKALFLVFGLLFSATGFCKPPASLTSKPFVLGVIEQIHSTVLAESRVLNIYLPDGYKKGDATKYPVIYLLDGSADEDFVHVVGLLQFSTFEWVNRAPKSIVVGIATVDRKRDFSFPSTLASEKKAYPSAGQSAKFIQFIETELQPFIEKKFATSGNKTLIGQSLGGLLATEILLKKPTLFNQYIIISPSLWWDGGSLLNHDSPIYQAGFAQPTTLIYIGVGKEGLTPTEIPRVMEVDANILADKLARSKSPGLKVIFDYLPQEDHATIMHQALYNALRQFHDAGKQ
jgi:uncharacterized protein